MRKAIWLLLIVTLLVTLAPLSALAQTPTPNEIDAIAKELWCPLCNGVRLDNCELQACIQMREVIAQRLTAGESREQIKDYFAQQYGDVVLGTPSREGFNLVVWVFPILAAVGGIGLGRLPDLHLAEAPPGRRFRAGGRTCPGEGQRRVPAPCGRGAEAARLNQGGRDTPHSVRPADPSTHLRVTSMTETPPPSAARAGPQAARLADRAGHRRAFCHRLAGHRAG